MLELTDEQREEINGKLRQSHVLVFGSVPSHEHFYNGHTLGKLTKDKAIKGYHVTFDSTDALKRVLSHQPKEGNLVVIVHGIPKFSATKDGTMISIPCPFRSWVVGEAIAKEGVFPIYFDGNMDLDRSQNGLYTVERGVTRVLPSSRTMDLTPEHLYENVLPLAFLAV